MNKMNKKVILTLIILVVMMIASCSQVFADSVSLSMSGGGTVNKGDTVSITLKYTGTTFGTAATDITYDSSILEYKSCTAVAGGGSGKLSISMTSGGSNNLSCTITFKALKSGQTAVQASTVEVYNMDAEFFSVGTKSVSVSVKDASAQASSNANLSSLKVSAGKLSPSFSQNTTSYTVHVDNDVTTCTLSVKTADSKASYKVSGSSSLAVGKNVRKVTVTAENGTTKTYTITITRAEKSSSGDEGDDPALDNPVDETPKQLETTVGDKTYIICEDMDGKDIPQGFTMTVALFGEYEIPVFKDKELKYTVGLLADKETGDEAWFFYNEETDTFSKSVSMDAETVIAYEEAMGKIDDSDSEAPSTFGTTEKVLFIALGSTILLLLIVVLVMQYKIVNKRKSKKEQ